MDCYHQKYNFYLTNHILNSNPQFGCRFEEFPFHNNTLRTLIQYPGGKTDPHFAMSANVRYINLWAFSGNGYLQSIDIPNNVQIINTEFLMYCPNVDTINYKGTISEWVSFEKRKNWNSYWLEYGYNYTIYCTDGQISKDGTVTYN